MYIEVNFHKNMSAARNRWMWSDACRYLMNLDISGNSTSVENLELSVVAVVFTDACGRPRATCLSRSELSTAAIRTSTPKRHNVNKGLILIRLLLIMHACTHH